MRNAEQISHWNGQGGQKWASRDDRMAKLLAPFSDALLERAAIGAARDVLEIGCGGGSLALQVAERLGPQGSVTGVDISAPLLEVAERRRALANEPGARVSFLQADAAVHDFGAATFDLLLSRFGVMFFDAPTEAFAHLRHATREGGQLAFCCWQELQRNPFVALPLEAALRVLPPPPAQPPRSPGPFAFAERDYLADILSQAGWAAVSIEAEQIDMFFDSEGDFAGNARELVNTGPVGTLLAEVDEAQRERVYRAAEELLAPHARDSAIVLEGAVWMVTADNGS